MMKSKEMLMFQTMIEQLSGLKPHAINALRLLCKQRAPLSRAKRGFLLKGIRSAIPLLACVVMPAWCVGLNDTGIKTCGDDTATNVALCATVSGDTQTFPRQDARYGRDADSALANSSGKGFGFSKIANDRTVTTAALGSGTTDWACTKDNVTGLTWEVKTTSGLRNVAHTYSWFNGTVGASSGGTCQNANRCDTQKYTSDVNATMLCGFGDWRLPSPKELQGIVDFGQFNPSIDSGYFPNTASANYWTSVIEADNPTISAWFISFTAGSAATDQDQTAKPVRLVRGAL